MKGREYCIDFISKNGVHYCTDLWWYDRVYTNDGLILFNTCYNIPLDSERALKIIE